MGDSSEHASGLFYLIERRGPEQIGTRRGVELFLLALLRLVSEQSSKKEAALHTAYASHLQQIHSFLHEDARYSDPGSIATLMSVFDPLFRALSMMSQTISLRIRLLRLVELGRQSNWVSSPASNIESGIDPREEQLLLLECFEMIDKFYVWDNEASLYWQRIFEGRGVPTGLGQMSSSTTHYDAETACIIILVRSARLILLLTMLLYHGELHIVKDAQGDSYDDLWTECKPFLESDVSKIIEDMLAAVPYALGDIDVNGKPTTMSYDGAAAIMIVHSIRLISCCAYATPAQLERADIVLKRMNSAIGIRSAVGWTVEGAFGLGLGMGRFF